MSIKVKQAIIKCLSKIEEDTFDEDTIRTLLIVSREYIPDGLIKELAHFVAHPDRNQGMFHKKVNSRYTKYKLIDEQAQSVDFNQLRLTIKTEDELSDFMLGGVSVEKVEVKLFDILYSDGLDDMPESHLVKYTGWKKSEVKEFLKKSYTKKDGFYYLNTITTDKLVKAIRCLPLSKYDPSKEPAMAAELQKAEETAEKIRNSVDRIQRVVRGAIFYRSVFETKTFGNEIVSTISKVIDKFFINKKYLQSLTQKSDEILLCVMTLLHDCKFIFYDKNQARAFLCPYLDYDITEAQKPSYNAHKVLYEKGVLALYLSGKETITFPLFVSDLPIRNYLSYEEYNKHSAESMVESPWTTACRIDKTLLLTESEVK